MEKIDSNYQIPPIFRQSVMLAANFAMIIYFASNPGDQAKAMSGINSTAPDNVLPPIVDRFTTEIGDQTYVASGETIEHYQKSYLWGPFAGWKWRTDIGQFVKDNGMANLPENYAGYCDLVSFVGSHDTQELNNRVWGISAPEKWEEEFTSACQTGALRSPIYNAYEQAQDPYFVSFCDDKPIAADKPTIEVFNKTYGPKEGAKIWQEEAAKACQEKNVEQEPKCGEDPLAVHISDLSKAPIDDSTQLPPDIKKWKDLINQVAEKYNIPAYLLANLMNAESGGNPNAISYAGAKGLFQIMPLHDPTANLFDPKINGALAGKILSANLGRSEGNVAAALSYYVQGPTGIEKVAIQNGIPFDPTNITNVFGHLRADVQSYINNIVQNTCAHKN